ncbi:hypothetical protein L0668_08405 [Paraglaciecola aquimarina]|uniref:Capsule biosynthesis protein n=1 Tax=Paraglaciecola algarum TaxID=3050085 RepID=A0ABS9D611_9ALTE|nr:hypothetical protein [Paraglaciecola sp. G1-23]MCF2948124.1 hypothetical protein [Paraglaciecola sp. G1-23]
MSAANDFMLDKSVEGLLKKLKPVALDALAQQQFMLFGSGGFANGIIERFGANITKRIEYPAALEKIHSQPLTHNWCAPKDASGTVVIGTGNGNYQYNQLCALVENHNIQEVLLVDPYLDLRNIGKAPPQDCILLLEHADGVVRHANHLKSLKLYFKSKGLTVVSVCPLTLFYYVQYWNCRYVLIFNGQRPLYDIAKSVFSNRKLTYVEYGFFPQKNYYYLDKKGVNHQSSLMHDDLTWVTSSHIEKLELVKKQFLNGFEHKSKDYVLVPLQVPDDVNIMNCSRFTNGMQEFIDYIIDYYPKDEKIVFKAHPKDPHRHSYDYRGYPVSDKNFISLLENAKRVHGITSSTLYEAALAGVEIVTEGISILSKHSHQLERLFAAMVDRQVKINELEPAYWVRNYSNIDCMHEEV